MIFGDPIESILLVAIIIIPVVAFVLYVFLDIIYRINDKGELLIKCNFLINLVIDISTIKFVKKTRNPISSPAASLDRIEIKYGKWDSVIISPKDKSRFVEELLKINPNIESELK